MPLKISGAAGVHVTSFDVSKAHLESLELEEAVLTQLAALIFLRDPGLALGWPAHCISPWFCHSVSLKRLRKALENCTFLQTLHWVGEVPLLNHVSPLLTKTKGFQELRNLRGAWG